jgi:type II restriction/modification system DNA methylase subunit YeeA
MSHPTSAAASMSWPRMRSQHGVSGYVGTSAEALGLEWQFPSIGPECVKGIEINTYAAELARVTVWIVEIQWMCRNGFDVERKPILRPLDTIECRDAVLNPDGTEAEWPEATVIIGNPPFLGGSKILSGLGEEYTERLRALYKGRVPGGADLVTYWFEKARAAIVAGKTRRAGLVATQAIRSGSNRKVLEYIKSSGDIYEAWDDEPWVVEGAAVRVSVICFAGREEVASLPRLLDGERVEVINSDLSSQEVACTSISRISQNQDVSFEGTKKYGGFDISGQLAREWLRLPTNPNGKRNVEVLKLWINGMDITHRRQDKWIIDFFGLDEESAALYEAPFQYAKKIVKPIRAQDKNEKTRINWWLFERNRPEMREAISKHSRYITTPRVAKHRLFVWMDMAVIPDSRLYVIARDDDTTFGILHSQFHEVWSLATCSWHGDGNEGGRPTYNAQSCFETFPFPEGMTPDIPAEQYADDPMAQKIAAAAKQLDELRNNWLNPPDLVMRVPEVVEAYPDRILPKDKAAARVLKQRTLTNLYNERPAWLNNAHRDLDEAVAEAYGWRPDLSDNEILTKLLALNLERAKEHPRQ